MKIALAQMSMTDKIEENLNKSLNFCDKAKDCDLLFFPEIQLSPFFPQYQNKNVEKYCLYESSSEIQKIKEKAKEHSIYISPNVYMSIENKKYDTSLWINRQGNIVDKAKMVHIAQAENFYEQDYYTPSDDGFKVFDTRFGTIGVGICWDQWFPETARCMALQGAELLFYPTAIGSEPILECDSMEHWRRCMQGHAASNLIPVIAANRIGEETVEPCPENGMQKSALNFYGSSFITDNTGALCAELPGGEEGVLVSTFDLDALKADRLNWGLFRDRRPEMYAKIVGK